MTHLPSLPETIGPEEPVVEFVLLECRDCGHRSPWTRTDDHLSHMEWVFTHGAATDHSRYYAWHISRNTARYSR